MYTSRLQHDTENASRFLQEAFLLCRMSYRIPYF